MNYRRLTIKALEENGYELKRNGTNHDIYYNKKLKKRISLERHNFDKYVYDYILKEIKHNSRAGS
ncbi:MAG: type II toxin-antitoxin system HicA family toxin [Eubacteriales bacterium]|nr:type II toxin-antitoxin system HicA family toxin [Eubacteriales bacterium]